LKQENYQAMHTGVEVLLEQSVEALLKVQQECRDMSLLQSKLKLPQKAWAEWVAQEAEHEVAQTPAEDPSQNQT
jgi:hypothetical protein